MNPTLKNFLRKYAPVHAARLLLFTSRLVRTKIIGFDKFRQLGKATFAHWHGDELALLPWFGNIHAALLVSRSQDGEMMAKGASFLGYHIVRGSSSRGAVGGMLSLIKATRQGYPGVLAVDGPRGPRHVCKQGIVRLSQKSGAPILPVGVAASYKYIFKRSWNQTFLPLPFSRQILFFGEPLWIGNEKDNDALNRYCKKIETALHTSHWKAMELLAKWHKR